MTSLPRVDSALRTLREGEGPAVVLVHSSGFSSAQWVGMVERLNAPNPILALDLWGYRPGEDLSAPDAVQRDRARVRAALLDLGRTGPWETRPVHLVGHSYGGFLALEAACNDRDLVASLTLFEPVAFGVLYEAEDEEGLADIRAWEGTPMVEALSEADPEPWVELFYDYWNGRGSYAPLPAPVKANLRAMAPKIFQEVRTVLTARSPLADLARRTPRPVMLVDGAATPPASRRVVAVLRRALGDASRATLPGAGHMFPVTHPGPTAEVLQAFLEGC